MDTALNPNNYPTYNVGDKVTIRQWDDMESEFGLNESGEIKVPKFFPLFMYATMHLQLLILIISMVVLRFFLLPCLNNLVPQLSAPPLSPLMIY